METNPTGSPQAGPWIIATACLLGLVGLYVHSTREIESVRQELAAVTASLNGLRETASVDIAGASTRGPLDAPVVFLEYSDYECPFCIRHFEQTMPQLDANYVQSGRIRYVFKDFPVDQTHPEAIRAHEAARCAEAQDQFWALHALLFSAPGTHGPGLLVQRAAEAGLDVPAFERCLASGETTAPIRTVVAEGINLGARGTPTFFVGLRQAGSTEVQIIQTIAGAQPYAVFAQALETALRQVQ